MSEDKSREQYLEEANVFLEQFDFFSIWPWDCVINVFRAMLNEVGLNRTMEATRHYNEAWGRAAVGIVKEILGPQENDLEQIAMTGYYGYNCTSMGHIKPLEIYEGGAICELYVCPNPHMKAPPEMCIAMSHIFCNAECRAVNPEYEVIFTHHLADGDDCCRWVLRKKSSKFTMDDLGRLEKIIPLELPMEEMYSYSSKMVVMSQLFTFTSALIDLVGSQRTLELVLPPARETGRRYGTKMKAEAGVKGDLTMINEGINLLVSLFQQTGPPAVVSSSGIERMITDCPCKGASPEVCKQFESVFTGVCEAINPDYEFVYDRMMSQGDTTCHWVVRKKGEQIIEVQDTGSKETPLELLKKRLVMGDIKEEEYKRLKALIEE